MSLKKKTLKWDESDVLGSGCKGTVVFRGHYGSVPVAVKRILQENAKLEVERELEALFNLKHDRLVQLFHVEKDDTFLRLALELCAGTLAHYCTGRYTGRMPDTETEALRQMLEGLAYLHSRRYVHRDIKPQNILITFSGGLKIADFGFCKLVTDEDSFSMSEAGRGTEGWMAPELLRNITALEALRMSMASSSTSSSPSKKWSGQTTSNEDRFRATTAIDVFPLGCVFYYFLTKGKHPFGIEYLRNGNILTGKSDLSALDRKHIVRGLIKEMINNTPRYRPKLDEVLLRPIFNTKEAGQGSSSSATSSELIKDDTKFARWLESLKSRFTKKSTNTSSRTRSNKKPVKAEIEKSILDNLDECDAASLRYRPLHHGANTWTAANFRGYQQDLQTVEEEKTGIVTDGVKVGGLVMSTVRPKNALSRSNSRRSRVFSAPEAWRRSLSVQRAARGFYTSDECLTDDDDEDVVDAGPSMTRSVSTSRLPDPSSSQLSLASSVATGSTVSLSRSFMACDLLY